MVDRRTDALVRQLSERLALVEARCALLERRLAALEAPSSAEQPDTRSIGEMLVARRRALGHAQAVVAQRFGVDQATVSRWEKGVRPEPERLAVLAAYLGIAIAEMGGRYAVEFGSTS